MSEFYPWKEAPPGDYCVLGDPISHSRSPQMHTAAFNALGMKYKYHAIQVHRTELETAIAHLKSKGYRGANVTVPLKEEAFRWCRHPDEYCLRVGSANTLNIETGVGLNTDGPGFIDTLVPFIAGEKAVVLGAGGAARAIAVSLEEAGYEVEIFNRTKENALRMVLELKLSAKVLSEPDVSGAALIVNATSSSLPNEPMDINWSTAKRGSLAVDLLYGVPTAFLDAAKKNGLRTVDGLPMLVAQGARSFEFWHGIPAPRQVMLTAVQ